MMDSKRNIRNAADAFAISCRYGLRELTDNDLAFYVHKFDIIIDDDVANYLSKIRNPKSSPIEQIPEERFVSQLNALSGMDICAFRPLIYQIIRNRLFFANEHTDTRKTIINDFWKEQSDEEFKADKHKDVLINYLRCTVAPELLLTYPQEYSRKYLGNSIAASFIYSCKNIYHEHLDDFVEKLYSDMRTIHKIDRLKAQINPYHNDRLQVCNGTIFTPQTESLHRTTQMHLDKYL